MLTSCSLKDAMDTGAGKAETSINPIADAKKISEDILNGSTITIKFPLSESTLDPIELDEVLETDSNTRNIFKKIWRNRSKGNFFC